MTAPNRRTFLGSSLLTGLTLAGISAAQSTPPSAAPRSNLPTGKLDKVKISRLIGGGNLLSGWCHQRDLLYVRDLAAAYLTEKKQFDTLQLMEQSGINTIMIDPMQQPIITKYKKERGGQIQTIVSVRQDWGDWSKPNLNNLRTEINKTVDQGPDLLFLHGGYCDRIVQTGKTENIEFLGKALDLIRQQQFLAGLGSHALEVPIACDQHNIKVDYYVKTFHHDRYWSATPKANRKPFSVDGNRSLDHNEFCDNIFCLDPEETTQYFATRKQPFIAFKVLAAGAIDPKSGFTYAFENGADFISVGMFDFNVAQDTMILKEVLKDLKRPRPWMA